MALFERLRKSLQGVRERWSGGISSLFSRSDLDESFWENLEELLVCGDVGVDLAVSMCETLRLLARKNGIRTAEALHAGFVSLVVQQLMEVPLMGTPLAGEGKMKVVLVIGVNGSGKTTSIGKIGAQLSEQGAKVLFAAADTFRAAAIEQLQVWGERTGIRVIAQQKGSDPAAVAFDAVRAGRAMGADFVLIDTAGRLHSKHNLMEELKKVYTVLSREISGEQLEVLLVLDAVTGQNGLAQAEIFGHAMPLNGVVLTKYDSTAKGGIILAIASKLKVPVRYIGVGEGVSDLRPFSPEEFVHALLGNEHTEG